jgi:hypothetical protein
VAKMALDFVPSMSKMAAEFLPSMMKMVAGFLQLDVMQGISLIEAIPMELLHRTQTRCNYHRWVFGRSDVFRESEKKKKNKIWIKINQALFFIFTRITTLKTKMVLYET